MLLRRIAALAKELEAALAGQVPVLIPVLTGSLRFAAQLAHHLQQPYTLHCVKIATYGEGTTPGQQPVFQLGPPFPPAPVAVVVEDIVDTGHTLQYIRQQLASVYPQVLTTSLLYKPKAYQYTSPPELVGFEIDNDFVVGYGMDYAEQGRYLNAIYRRYEP